MQRWFRSPVVARKTHDALQDEHAALLARNDDYIQRLVQAEQTQHDQGEQIQELMAAVARLEKHNELLARTIARMNTPERSIPTSGQS